MGVRFSHGLPILLFVVNAYAFHPPGIDNYIPNFPELVTSIEYVEDVNSVCKTTDSISNNRILGCSKISFQNKTCKIILPYNYKQWVLEHEKAHCIGGDHNNMLLDAFNRYKQSIGQ